MTPNWTPPDEFDDYVIERPLGAGQMGLVYLASDAVLARQVAVKFIAGATPDAAARQRFLTEARATARLQHPNVVTIYRVGELDQKPYLVSEFVRGRTLDQIERPQAGDRVLELGIELARGLAAAHRSGVIHRDIKPANAILSDDGIAKLLDFGLATVGGIGGDSGGRPTIVGTPDYMAPEIWRAQPADSRSDVYALGALLYELATGNPPFHDVAPRELARAVQERAAPPVARSATALDLRLAAVIDRCLETDPDDRFATGDALRDALEGCRRTTGAVTAIPGGNPYRGLRPFEADHRALFFGRTVEVGTIVDRMRAESFVLVSGDSGSGKSSLCRAAVLPAIAGGALDDDRAWSSTSLVPGRRPLRALALALAGALDVAEDAAAAALRGDAATIRGFLRDHLGDERGLVVFVDQLEEIVTLPDADERAAADHALVRLVAGVPGLRLLATVRADFLGRMAALPELGERIHRALAFLRPLDADQIRDVIVGPATATGVRFESDALVDTLVTAAAGTEGGLPLLQFALAELWAARDTEHDLITAAALDSIGGVDGALARHADSVVDAMSESQRDAARRVLARLVTAEGTRARRGDAELATDAATRGAIDALVGGRLLVAHEADDGSAYELSHEVLVRGWGTLRRWLLEDSDHRLAHDRIRVAAAEWQRLVRSRDALWGSRQLADVARIHVERLTPTEVAFLDASRRTMRRRKWRRWGIAAAAPLIALAVYAGVEIANRRDLDERVESAVAAASEAAAEARRHARLADNHRATAMRRFGTSNRFGAEAAWARALAADAEADRAYARAARRFEIAVSQDPSRDAVKAQLGRVLYERALRADRDAHVATRDELIERVPLYDPDGSLMAAWAAPAPLRLASTTPGATATIATYVDRGGRFELAPPRALGALPVSIDMAPGSYVVELSAPHHATIRHPIVIGRGTPLDVAIALPAIGDVPDGYAYVAPGWFEFGTIDDEDSRAGFFNTTPKHPMRTGGYVIGKTEVTYGEWIEFLDTLAGVELRERSPHAEADVSGVGAVRLDKVDGTWRFEFQPAGVLYAAAFGEPIRYRRDERAEQPWTRMPVTAITAHDAEAYAGWLDRTGRVPGARLCTEVEWERAASGADDRRFPHGHRMAPDDANIDITYGKDPAAMGPDAVGSHPASTSPYGMADASGNAFEWTTGTLSGGYVVRGGSYFYDTKTANIANRGESTPTLRNVSVGVRICASRDAYPIDP